MSKATEDRWDKFSREPPPILCLMQLVWSGQKPPRMDEDYHRTLKWMQEDPKGFGLQLVGLEKAYQLQLREAAERDRRLATLTAENKALKEQLQSGEHENSGEPDAGEERALDLIDRLRRQCDDERPVPPGR